MIDKFENFIRSFGATRVLLQRAHDEGFLIEGLILYAALVDGFCRSCLILKEQLDNKNSNINEKYIYQGNNENNFRERDIYKLAFDKKIIDQDILDELNKLYDIRNKLVHRFFISEVEYSHLEVVCKRYEKLYQQLYKITFDLESEQIDKNVGMTINGGKITEQEKIAVSKDIMKKIKSGNERNLAKTFDCVSVEEVVEFASKKGLTNKCKCGHYKSSHIDLEILKKKKTKDIDEGLTKCSQKGCYCQKYIRDDKDKI